MVASLSNQLTQGGASQNAEGSGSVPSSQDGGGGVEAALAVQKVGAVLRTVSQSTIITLMIKQKHGLNAKTKWPCVLFVPCSAMYRKQVYRTCGRYWRP